MWDLLAVIGDGIFLLTYTGYTYILALRALIADRHAALTGEQNLFISEETQRALDTPDKIQADLFWQLLTRKDENVQFGGLGDVRHHLSELRTLVNGLKADGKGGNGRAASEAQLAEPHLRTVQTMLSEHTKICQTLFR